MRPSVEEIREVFRLHDVRCTRQRELVYGELAATKRHPTAEELFESVRGLDGGISLATVYNTLEVLQGAGLCRRLTAATGPARFDADMSNHVHMTTPEGSVVDLPGDLSKRVLERLTAELAEELRARTGMAVTGLSIQVEPAGGGVVQ